MKYLNSAKRRFKDVTEVVYILVDMSGSMYASDYLPTRLEGAIEANMKFIETKIRLHPQDYVGIIGFGGRGYLLCPHIPVAEGVDRLRQSFDRKSGFSGGTDFTSALMMAEKCLLGNDFSAGKLRSGVSRFLTGLFMESDCSEHDIHKASPLDETMNRRIIMLTDGQHNGFGDPVKIAKRLKDSRVSIECIGIAGRPESVDSQILKMIASVDENNNPRYYFIKDTSELVRKYESMAHHLRIA